MTYNLVMHETDPTRPILLLENSVLLESSLATSTVCSYQPAGFSLEILLASRSPEQSLKKRNPKAPASSLDLCWPIQLFNLPSAYRFAKDWKMETLTVLYKLQQPTKYFRSSTMH